MEISNYTRCDPDRCILEFDKALRILYGEPDARRPSPADAVAEEDLRDEVRRDAAALMRVNHCGEVCAQALYQGQALASSSEPATTPIVSCSPPIRSHPASMNIAISYGQLSLGAPAFRRRR